MARTGVIVTQLGGPKTLDDVEPFIRSILNDPNLVPLPGGVKTRTVFGALVARVRAPRVRARYAEIGGGSPIVETTQLQADALSTELERRGHDVLVAVAHGHSQPDTEAAVDTMISAEVDNFVMLPMFPQYSSTTTGSSERELRRVLTERGCVLPVKVIRSWCEHPSYLRAQAKLIDQMLVDLPDDELDEALVVFSAHGLPQSIVDRGDPYLEEIEACVAAVAERLKRPVEYTIAFQSKVGPVEWLGPDVRDVVTSEAEAGRTILGVVPISFVSEHLETLHELDIELKAQAAAAGIYEFRRSACFDADEMVGPMLADVVEDYL